MAFHFTHLLAGLQRVGLAQQDICMYFKVHLSIDPYHGEEFVAGFTHQVPALDQRQVDAVLRGAHLALAAGVMQADSLLRYLVQMA